MNYSLELQAHVDSGRIRNILDVNPQVILHFLRQIQVGQPAAAELLQALEIRNLELGDELINYSSSASINNPHDDDSYFHIVCQGRVRLLGLEINQQREVSTLAVEAGETFGTENFFGNETVAYRAIAASAVVQVAQISVAQLKPWLEQLPSLRDYLRHVALERQVLMFFKTCTELHSLPSYTLRQLLPYVVEIRLNPGTSLAEATPASAGRFWLKSGQIQTSSSESQPPQEGQSWGYPDSTAPDWIAETDLVVYHLPVEYWQTASAIAPQLSRGSSDANNLNHNWHAIRKNPPYANSISLPTPNLQSETPSAEAWDTIPFPQPTRRWQLLRWRGYPLIEQQSTSDCGVACLAMISQYWGKRFSLNTLRNLAGVDRVGASLKGLAQAAETVGFEARPVRASFSRLELQTNPWIAHWEGIHYVVVWRVKGDRVFISDPAVGKRSLSRQEFQASWTGYALVLNPTERLQAARSDKVSLGQFWRVVQPYRNLLVQIILASLLLQIGGLIAPVFTQIVIDHVVLYKSFATLNVFALGLLVVGIWSITLTAVRQYLLDYFANRMDLTLISGFINHTLSLPLQFFGSRQVKDIITRVQENQKIQVFLTRQVISGWLDTIMAVFFLALMAYYSLPLTILVLALIPPVAILTVVVSPFLRQVSREIFIQAGEQNSALVEMIAGIATIKSAAAERDVRWRWEDRFTGLLDARFRGQKLLNRLQLTTGLINSLGSTALLWYGATLILQDQLTIGQFVAFNMLAGQVISPVLALVGLWHEFQEVVVSVERLNDVFLAEAEESPQKPLLVLPPIRGEVVFENVTFRYAEEEERNAVQNISFRVQPGQSIAIVGRSGAGKSTLIGLLQGLYRPKSGRIWIDGHDISHASPQSLRSQLGVVPQECFLFSGTILENITLYSDNFTLEQVIEAAKLAEAHAFIQALPLGYYTQVGERGMPLSGGQRQRIAIARAILKNPQILILDEATSSVDTESAQRFQRNLAQISHVSEALPAEPRTTFIVAHRLCSVRNADRILVLDRGILIEQGTHEELMALKGFYYHLAQEQLELH